MDEIRYGGRQAGKSFFHEAIKRGLTMSPGTVIGIDYGKDGGASVSYAIDGNGNLVITEIVHFDGPVTVAPEPKKLHHNDGFFPNKVGRIANLPRYPGVWG